MANPLWNERLVAALRRQGLPTDYVNRLVEELTDHATDLSRENNSMEAEQNVEARLGSPEYLATFAKKELQRLTFAGRHPVVTFVAGPIVAVIGTFLVTLLLGLLAYGLLDVATGGSLTANDDLGLPPSPFELGVMQFANLVVRFVPFALSAWLFVRLGRRARVRTWSFVACGIVAAVAISFWSEMIITSDGMGAWFVGFGWRNDIALGQILQALVPLALGVWQLRQISTRPWKTLAT